MRLLDEQAQAAAADKHLEFIGDYFRHGRVAAFIDAQNRLQHRQWIGDHRTAVPLQQQQPLPRELNMAFPPAISSQGGNNGQEGIVSSVESQREISESSE